MKRILIAALAVLGAVSCAKETVGPESDVYTIDAFIENVSTRTQIVDNSGSFSLEWSDGDSFSLFDGASLLTFSRVGGTSRFTSATAPAAAEKYYAYYPGNAVNSAADGRFTVTLPSEIDYTEGNITAGQFPMSGVSTETGVSFRNLCALVSFTVNADAADRNRKLKTITLAATKAICGEATVNFGADELSVTGDGRSVSINCNGLSLDEARTFHFTVPTGEYDTLLVRFETQDSGYGMIDAKKGVVLNISSMNAMRPLTKIPAYSAAKGSINNFTQWYAVHVAQLGIRCNAIAPGFFLTDQNRFLLTEEGTGALKPRGKKIIANTPTHKFGEPEDLVGTMLYLLSDISSFVTGIVIPVDGGYSAFGGV